MRLPTYTATRGLQQQGAQRLSTQALDKFSVEKDMAAFVKKEFDKKHNPTWHCIVGRNFGSYVTHETKHFIYFYCGALRVLTHGRALRASSATQAAPPALPVPEPALAAAAAAGAAAVCQPCQLLRLLSAVQPHTSCAPLTALLLVLQARSPSCCSSRAEPGSPAGASTARLFPLSQPRPERHRVLVLGSAGPCQLVLYTEQ